MQEQPELVCCRPGAGRAVGRQMGLPGFDVVLGRAAPAVDFLVERFAGAQFDTLRLRLIKIAARVVEMKTQIRLHMPTACPDQSILRIVLSRIPRLVT